MRRVTQSSTCLTSAQELCDSSWHLVASWINPGWNCCLTHIEAGISFKQVKCKLTLLGDLDAEQGYKPIYQQDFA